MAQSIKQDTQNRAIILEGLAPFVALLACGRAWLTLVLLIPTSAYFQPFNLHNAFDCAYCLVGVLVATRARQYVPLVLHSKMRLLSLFLMLSASVLSIVIQIAPALPQQLNGAFSILMALLGGAGFGLLLLLSAENISSLPLVKIAINSVMGSFFSSALIFFIGDLHGIRLFALEILLPVLAYIALKYQCRYVTTHGAIATVVPKFHYPWRLFILFAAFCFVYGLRSQQLAAGAGRHSSLSTAILMIVLFVVIYFFADRYSVMKALQVPFALLICCFMLVPGLGISSSLVQDYLIAMSYSLMSFLVTLSVFAIAKQRGIPVALLYGVFIAAQFLIVLGEWGEIFLTQIGLAVAQQEFIINVVAMIIMISAALFFFFDRNNTNHWESRALSAEMESSHKTADLLFQKKCEFVTESYHLSPREAEVFNLLAKGCSNAEIESELFIAEGTVKAHTRHIYEKLGINSRKSLAEFIESMDVS